MKSRRPHSPRRKPSSETPSQSPSAASPGGKRRSTADSRPLEQFSTILDHLAVPVYVTDPATYELLYANRAFREKWGELRNEPCHAVLQGRREPCPFCRLPSPAETDEGTVHRWEFRDTHEPRWYECLTRMIQWMDGRQVGCQIAVDITDYKLALEALADSRRTLDTLMNHLPGMVYRCDNDAMWTMTFVSQGCLALTGYPPEDLIGNRRLSYSDLIHPDDREWVWNQVQTHVRGGEPFELVYRIRTAGQAERWVWEQGRGVFSPDGTLLFLEGFITDITERRRLEERLQEARKLETIATLARGVAHDYNNLLAVIMGNASMIQKQPAIADSCREALAEILEAARRGSALTQQLLAFARRGLSQQSVIDMEALLREVCRDLAAETSAGIGFEVRRHRSVPPVLGDALRLRQAFANICRNAFQASPPGEQVSVEVDSIVLSAKEAADHQVRPGRYVRIRVIDAGAGIPEEILSRVFEPFFTTRETAQGMGLPAALGIVQGHDGAIHLDSTVGRGTTVTVLLPATEGSAPLAETPVGLTAPNRPPRGQETVLVVDDQPQVAGVIQQMLSALGYCVVVHHSAAEALHFLETHAEEIDLILCDIHMPVMGGGKLLEAVQTRHPHIAAIIVSGSEADEQAVQPFLAAGIPRVSKPFSMMTLARTVREVLDRRR